MAILNILKTFVVKDCYLSSGWEKEDLLQITGLVGHKIIYNSCEIMNFSLLFSWFVMHKNFSKPGLRFAQVIIHRPYQVNGSWIYSCAETRFTSCTSLPGSSFAGDYSKVKMTEQGPEAPVLFFI